MKLTTNEQKKKFIKRVWPVASGVMISEMIRRYWAKPKQEEIKIETPKPTAEDLSRQIGLIE